MGRLAGFTLIELLIVIAIIAIIASIAYPSYQSYLLKGRRGEAKMELIKAQLQQSSLHILNPSYSNNESDLGLFNSRHYTFTVISASSTTYSIQATAQEQQVNDTGCTTLTVYGDSAPTPLNCW
ncbi:MAG: type IV pilin protein [Psychromonas sp.]